MKNEYMKKETDGLINQHSTHDLTLPTWWMKVHIEKHGGAPLCKMCNEWKETIAHLSIQVWEISTK